MTLIFISPDPSKALGLEQIVKDLHIICTNRHPIIDYFESKSAKIFCLEDLFNLSQDEIDRLNNTGKLFEHIEVLKYLKLLQKQKKSQLNILVFKPSTKISKISKDNNFKLLVNDANLCRNIEDKCKFFDFLKKAQKAGNKKTINIPEYQISVLNSSNYEDLKDKFAEKFVIQFGRGFAGNSTFFINSKEEFENLCESQGDFCAKITKYMDGYTLTINCCVTDLNTIVSQPFVQITGDRLLQTYKGGTCGVSFSAINNIDKKITNSLIQQSLQIGQFLKNEGYKGIFGLDFVIDKEKVFIIECNPRMTISVAHFTLRQIALGHDTLILAEHLKVFAYDKLQKTLKTTNSKQVLEELRGASLILRNVFKKDIILKNALNPCWYIWNTKNNNFKMTNLEFGFKIIPTTKKDEIAFLPLCLGKGSQIHEGNAFCDIYFWENILDKKMLILPEIRKLTEELYAFFTSEGSFCNSRT